MKTKEEIVQNWLPRYTGTPLESFGSYILLTNFKNYVDMFAKKFDVEILGQDRPMQTATANDITIINFGMGSPMAATVMDILSAISPKAVLFLGKCGGLKKNLHLGDLILPIAAGGFIYIAVADLIPELQKTKEIRYSILQIAAIIDILLNAIAKF